ncbi:hypothetical protein [Polaromonas sp.]|uniref:type I restriction enzyme subunit R domain-containing protein n=1 Tax=Polaromonas sp. TaxID=1869339 RepID=UPI003565D984
MRLKAVDNFCKSFDLEDPDKTNTGIAFLIVCDMLLTGFDAPVEQVMYIDKRLREHTLLQAIARTNRVRQGKKRGYIVDYIGLANHLTDALTLYAASDEMQELHDGLQNITSELQSESSLTTWTTNRPLLRQNPFWFTLRFTGTPATSPTFTPATLLAPTGRDTKPRPPTTPIVPRPSHLISPASPGPPNWALATKPFTGLCGACKMKAFLR